MAYRTNQGRRTVSTKVTHISDGLIVIALESEETPRTLLASLPEDTSDETFKILEWAVEAARKYEREKTTNDIIKLLEANHLTAASELIEEDLNE